MNSFDLTYHIISEPLVQSDSLGYYHQRQEKCMEQAIGIIGGVGPFAGVDLLTKIFKNTIASRDQEHLNVYLTNIPSKIGDRTQFLLHGGDNPADGLFESFSKLAQMGATVVAIPCNTAHAPAIYQTVALRAAQEFPQVTLLNMIEETCAYTAKLFSEGATIGLLATKGTHEVGLYRQYFAAYPKFQLIEPDAEGRNRVHEAIYHTEYGIKAMSPVSDTAKGIIMDEGAKLLDAGASALILGCTELPLAVQECDFQVPLIDPTLLLARAAIRMIAPDKLCSR